MNCNQIIRSRIINGPIPARQTNQNNKFWNFVNNSEDTAELQLYGDISSYESWWSDVVTPQKFKDDLKALGDKKEITVRINSGGGDVFAANAIYTSLKDHSANITVKIDGIAASAATIIAMAGDKIAIPANAYMMIHNPKTWPFDYLEAKDMRKMADTLDTIKEGIINAYVSKTGKDKNQLSEMMDNETWFTGEDAVTEGFADEIMFETSNQDEPVLNGNLLIINSVSHDLSSFKNRPTLPAVNLTPKKPEVVNINKNIKEKGEEKMPIKNAAELKEQMPDIFNEVFKSGKDAEKQRLQAIDELAGKVDNDLLNKAKYEDNISAQEVAFQAMKEGKFVNLAHIANVAKDAVTANQVPGEGTQVTAGDEDNLVLASVSKIAKNAIEGGR